MSRRNSREAKTARRHKRSIRHVGGCAICSDPDVVFVDEDAPDPFYRAICRRHLAYAVATIFAYDGPGTRGPSRRTGEQRAHRLAEARRAEPDHPKGPRFQAQGAVQEAMERHRRQVGEALSALYGYAPVDEALRSLWGFPSKSAMERLMDVLSGRRQVAPSAAPSKGVSTVPQSPQEA